MSKSNDFAHAHEKVHAHPASPGHGRKANHLTIDPVCGMRIDPATAAHHADHADETYFCSGGCRTKFITDPARYLDGQGREEVQVAPGSI